MSSKLTANVYKKSKKREIALSAHSSDILAYERL